LPEEPGIVASPRRASVAEPYTSVVRVQSPPVAPGARSATPPVPPRSTPAFLSPTHAGRADHPRLKEGMKSPREGPLPSPRRSPTPRRGAGAGDRSATFANASELVETFGGAAPDKNKYLFEIQHLLVSRSKDELEGIVKSLRH